MPFNGSGTYGAPSLPGTWNPAQSGSTIDPTDWNTLLTDISTALTNTICKDGQSTISANIPFATHRITGLGEPVGAQDAATKAYADNAPWSYLGGLTTSRASATTLAVAAGKCNDSTNTSGSTIYLPSGMTKSTAGAWASGNNSNGMGNGLTIANTTWYHVHGIINAGAADVYFDTSVTAANKPTSTTAFRRVGSFLTNGSAQIIAYIQIGDEFLWAAPVSEWNSTAVPLTATLVTLSGVPTGVQVWALIRQSSACSSASGVLYQSPDETSAIASATAGNADGSPNGNANSNSNIMRRTNTAAQLRWSAVTAGTTATGATYGWRDRRGQDA